MILRLACGLAGAVCILADSSLAGDEKWSLMIRRESVRLTSVERVFGRFWAVGEDGVVYVSDDGKFWGAKSSFTSKILYDVSFPESDRGCVVGEGGLAATTDDAGDTWTVRPTGVSEDLRGVSFANRDVGCAVGIKGTLLMTYDGGRTWLARDVGYGESFFGVIMASYDSIWVVGERGMIMRSEDAGRTWRVSRRPGSRWLYGVWFSEETGWAVGQDGYALRFMLDRWDEIPIPGAKTLYDVAGTSAQSVCVSGAGGQMWRTEDAGMSWERLKTHTGETISGVAFAGTLGWAVGPENSLLSSNDGGKSWGIYSLVRLPSFTGVSFADQSFGWCAGRRGLLWNTTDGGENWTQQASGQSKDINAVCAVSRKLCVAAGADAIIKTDNGGDRWRQVYRTPVLTDEEAAEKERLRINDVFFFDERRGWAVGSEGCVLYSRSEAEYWDRILTSVECDLEAVWFVSPNRGFVAGSDGQVYQSKNGGREWKACASSGSGDSLKDIFFLDADHGWVVGDGGTILRTQDGGRNWRELRLGGDLGIAAVHFVSVKRGWLAGERGLMMKSWDGGETWVAEQSPLSTDFNDLCFVTPQLGWAVGERGAIVGYASPSRADRRGR